MARNWKYSVLERCSPLFDSGLGIKHFSYRSVCKSYQKVLGLVAGRRELWLL
jgi:hypothetical protein